MSFKNLLLPILFSFVFSPSKAQQITKEGLGFRYQNIIYSKLEIQEIFLQNLEAKSYYDKFVTKKQQAIGGYISGATIIAAGGGYALYEYNKGCQGGPCISNMILGVGIGLIGIVIEFFAVVNQVSAHKNLNRALDTFNKNQLIGNSEKNELHISTTNNGLGIKLSF